MCNRVALRRVRFLKPRFDQCELGAGDVYGRKGTRQQKLSRIRPAFSAQSETRFNLFGKESYKQFARRAAQHDISELLVIRKVLKDRGNPLAATVPGNARRKHRKERPDALPQDIAFVIEVLVEGRAGNARAFDEIPYGDSMIAAFEYEFAKRVEQSAGHIARSVRRNRRTIW